MNSNMTHLQASVTAMNDTVDSAEALLAGLSQMLKDNAEDPAAINDIANQLDAKQAELAASLVANTPATGAGPVVPPAGAGADKGPTAAVDANGNPTGNY